MGAPTVQTIAAHNGRGPARAPSLEYRSFLSAEHGEAHLSIWPEAGEASITVLPWWFAIRGKAREPRPPDLRAHLRSNGRRAARAVRLFCRANELTYLWTLTYGHARTDRAQVSRELVDMFTRMQARWGRLPCVAVIERGRRGTKRLHVHLAVPLWLPIDDMRDVWGHGHVWVGDPGKLPGRVSSRRLSGYLSKYIAKEVAAEAEGEVTERVPGAHRYQVTRGWSPIRLRRRFWSISDGEAWLRAYYGEAERAWEWGDTNLVGVQGVVLVYGDDRIHAWKDPPVGNCGPAGP